MRTHYDNLKVARNAPPEIIRAAYKVLCQKYHPDKYTGGAEAADRIMKIINAAYAVLSDPDKRREYDQALDEMEAMETEERKRESGYQDHGQQGERNQRTGDRVYGSEAWAEPPPQPDDTRQEPPRGAAKSRGTTANHHPWRRVFARYIDMNIFAPVGGVGFAFIVPFNEAQNPWAGLLIDIAAGLTSCILLEPVVLMLFGGTPGKAILNLALQSKTLDSIKSLSFSKLVERTFHVYFHGLWLGLRLPVAPAFFMFEDYKRLRDTGDTRWDIACGTQVNPGHLNIFRFLIGAMLVCSFAVLNQFAKVVNKAEIRKWVAAEHTAGVQPQASGAKTAPATVVNAIVSDRDRQNEVTNEDSGPTPVIYLPLEPPFVVKFKTSQDADMVQIDITLMSTDQAVIDAVKTHYSLLRNNLLLMLSDENPGVLKTKEGKEALRGKIKRILNQLLIEQYRMYAGVDEVFFTGFIMQ